MTGTQKYSKAPVALAVIEIKHPASVLTKGEALGMKALLRASFPFHREDDVTTQTVDFLPDGPRTNSASEHLHIFESRTRSTRLVCAPLATTIETTEYDRWDTLLAQARTGLAARAEVSEIEGYERVGLRYIDEIRVPGEGRPDWSDWIKDAFLAPSLPSSSLQPVQQNSVVQYQTGQPGRTVTTRFGAVYAAPAVVSDMRAAAPAMGHYFLLDTDVAWERQHGEVVPEFAVDGITGLLSELHGHASTIFESVVTPRLRTEVFQ